MTSRLVLTIALLAALQEAHAESWYLGFAGGVSRADASGLERGYGQDAALVPNRNFTSRLVTSSYFDQASGAWRAFVGWKATTFVAAELSYADYGTEKLGYGGIHRTCCGSPAFDPIETRDARRGVTAWGADLIGTLPIGSTLDGVAGIGAARVQTKLKSEFTSSGLDQSTGGASSVSDHSTAARFMVGVNWSPFRPWSLRVSYEYLSKVGTPFAIDGSGGDHTGRSWQQALWVGVQREF